MMTKSVAPASDKAPALKDMLLRLGRHREKERQRILRPREREERARLSAEADAIIDSPAMDAVLGNPRMDAAFFVDSPDDPPPTSESEKLAARELADKEGNMRKRLIQIQRRLAELEQIFETIPDDSPYRNHPLCFLCTELEDENLCDPKGNSAPLGHGDLEHAAYRLDTPHRWKEYESGPKPAGIEPVKWVELRWLTGELRKRDAEGIGARIYSQLVERCQDVMIECELSDEANSTVSILKQRSDFERQYRLDNEPYNPRKDAKNMRAAYVAKYPDDPADATGFRNARKKFPL